MATKTVVVCDLCEQIIGRDEVVEIGGVSVIVNGVTGLDIALCITCRTRVQTVLELLGIPEDTYVYNADESPALNCWRVWPWQCRFEKEASGFLLGK